jgi:hypothetical protein
MSANRNKGWSVTMAGLGINLALRFYTPGVSLSRRSNGFRLPKPGSEIIVNNF